MADLPDGKIRECMDALAPILGEDIHAVVIIYPDMPVIAGRTDTPEIRVGVTDRDAPDRAAAILAGTTTAMLTALDGESRFSLGGMPEPAVRVRNRDH